MEALSEQRLQPPAVCLAELNRFHVSMRHFQGPVDAAYAAAVVGLQTETFLGEGT